MLKKMFEEIQSRLGDEYCLFSEFNPRKYSQNTRTLACCISITATWANCPTVR